MIFGRNILKPNVVNWFSCTATYITPEATKHLLLCVLRYTTLSSYMLNFQGHHTDVKYVHTFKFFNSQV